MDCSEAIPHCTGRELDIEASGPRVLLSLSERLARCTSLDEALTLALYSLISTISKSDYGNTRGQSPDPSCCCQLMHLLVKIQILQVGKDIPSSEALAHQI